MHHPTRLIAALTAILLALAPSFASTDHDLWYIIEMAGQRSGTLHSVQRTEGDRITSISETRLKIRRDRAAIEVAVTTEFVETLDGKPISMSATQVMGAEPTTMTYTFGPEGVTITTRQGNGEPTTVTAPLPEGAWLTPAAAATFTRKRLEAGATEITARIIDPSFGLQPIVSTRRVLERTTVEALGKVVPAIKCAATVSAVPGIESIEYLDERGVPIRTTSNLGGIPMTIIAADRELANLELDPPELMQRTFVSPDRPIKSPRAARRASYLLRLEGGDGTLATIPTTAIQRTEAVEPGVVRVVVDLDNPTPAPAADAEDGAYLASSSMLPTEDDLIRRLVEQATAKADGATPAERAEAMRRFVHTYINAKSLGVGFASAAEVARTREGDCTEHATLLAAMLRVAGIPSRTASGLIYADSFGGSRDIFGYHMWTQALLEVDGRMTWVDLDATLGPKTPTDATHIALATAALGDAEPTNPLIALVPLLGRLEVSVEHAE